MKMKMKFISKALFAIALMLVSLAVGSGIALNSTQVSKAAVDNSINVVSPNGGEYVSTNDTITVQWTMSGIVGPAGESEVWLMKGGAFKYLIKDRYTSSSNLIYWTIPASLQAGSDYKVRVMSTDYPAIYDESDNYFSINSPTTPYIQVSSPNSGENWIKRGTYNITWASSGISNVSIILIWDTNGGTNSIPVATFNNTNPGSYIWTIPTTISARSNYRIRVFSLTGNVSDDSDNYFSIVDDVTTPEDSDNSPDYTKYPPTNISREKYPDLFSAGFARGIYVGSSNTTPRYTYGQHPNPLSPKQSNNPYDIIFDYCFDENQLNEAIVIQNDGKIGVHGVGLSGSLYKCVNGVLVEKNQPYIQLTSLNSGEQVRMGQDVIISWNSAGINNKIISFYKGGSYIKEIRVLGDTVSTGGAKIWKLDESFVPGNDYKVRISDESYKYSDESDNYFSVVPSEGAIIQAYGDIDVYIIKYKGNKAFKRLVLSPSVFNSYGHLKWENLIKVNRATLNKFQTSNLVRSENGRIYRLTPNGDVGLRNYVSTSVFQRLGFDMDSVYQINTTDEYSYVIGGDLN